MTCTEASDRLLEADLEELRGEGSGELASHLALCPRCRAVARRLLEDQQSLDAALASMAEGAVPGAPAEPAVPRAAWRRAFPGARALPWGLVAAAVLAALVIGRQLRHGAAPEGIPEVATAPPADLDVDVTPAPGQSAVVFRTADPNITIVWLFQGRSSP